MILVMSGTKDGRDIIEKLSEKKYKLIATTVTEYGGELINKNEFTEVISRSLDCEGLSDIIRENGVKILIDATHPYAVNGSKNALIVSEKMGIPYVRFERANIEDSYGIRFNNYEDAEEFLYKNEGNILFTIGSNNIEKFTTRIPKERMFIRILPMSKIIAKCEKMGFNPQNIIAMQGPFSKDFNEAMIKELKGKFLVTKDTSETGGFREKLEAAKSMGISLIVINKPKIEYKNEFNDIDSLIKFINKLQNNL